MQLSEHPYASFLRDVEKPTRYTGAEHGARQKDWSSVRARICLAFPDVYDIGMSHLGYRILYKILNDDPRTLAERAYTPWLDMQDKLREHGKLLVSLESARPLCDFDVVGFSLQYELTFTNVLTMLELGGIPRRSSARSDADPLILGGGPVATHAEPVAPFFDALLIGDGEEAATEIALAWVEAREAGLSRAEALRRLAQLPGVYVPSLYETGVDDRSGLEVVTRASSDAPFPVERRLLDDIDRFPFPDDGPVGGPEAIFDRLSIEVARGCTEGCRFCQAGMIYRPVRERDPEQIVDSVLSALENTGQDEVSLTALSTADVSCIAPLIRKLVERTAPERVSLGVASLRAYGLGEDLLDEMRKVRASGLTFAPEAGTQRMRDVINKNVTEEQLLETAERVFSRGFDKMKLYFICGLPTETDEDVLGIVDVGKHALGVGKRLGRRAKVTVSVSVHVPKPHTPFQWCAMDSLEEIARKQALLRGASRGVRGLELRMHPATTSVLEAVLARGDRCLADVVERAFENGARFDSWEDRLRSDAWQEAFEHFGIDTSRYLGTLPVSGRLPWDHLDIGLEDGFLAREYRKALASRLSPPCGKPAGDFIHPTNVRDAEASQRRLVCYDCGVACDLSQMREQRIGFLRKMGSLVPTPDPDPQPPGQNPTLRARAAPERHRPVRPGPPPERFRLRFAKRGAAALLGHLDLARELPRVLRRAGIRCAYSEGFHPKPDLSFAPALALGIASLDEYFDAKLIAAPEPRELVARLNAAAASGFQFLDAVKLGPNDKGLSRIVTGARYVVGVPEAVLGDVGLLAERAAAFVATHSACVTRRVAGIGKKVDVRKFVVDLTVGGERELATLADAGFVGRFATLAFAMHIGQNGTARIGELLEALLGAPQCPYVAVRTRLVAGAGSPLELALHRGASSVAQVTSP
jgi:radical SAM family uncharacterized protein/radical SAM-linked protein